MIFSLKYIVFLICFSAFENGFAQSPNQIINTVNDRFRKVNDYKADVNITCDISFIKVDPINAKVIYRKPDKFRVKAAGILILPKQNLDFFLSVIADTNSYTSVMTGEEVIGGIKTKLINIIPSADSSDLVLGKFWIDAAKGLVLKSQLTTRSQGTILIENSFGLMSDYALPDKMTFTIDAAKFKIPKAVSADINNNNNSEIPDAPKKGKITMRFSNYVLNKGVSNDEFK